MNTKILQKVLDELNKPEPDLSYIKGMIEAIVPEVYTPLPGLPSHSSFLIPKEENVASNGLLDERAILESMAASNIERIKNV